MIKTKIFLSKTIEDKGLRVGVGLFIFILNSSPMTRDITYSRLYLDEKIYGGNVI